MLAHEPLVFPAGSNSHLNPDAIAVVMELLRFAWPVGTPLRFHFSRKKRDRICNVWTDKEESDQDFRTAVKRASLRFRETLRTDPLLIDPYIGCLVPPDKQVDENQDWCGHCLVTKFIDDKLLSTMHQVDGPRQIVLWTDGMDTRPYRLNWLPSTVIFDVSPERIFRRSAKKLQDVGAKVSRRCKFIHVPSETSDIQQHLLNLGFNGTRPSLWVFQGFPIISLVDFKNVLGVVSSLATKGCLLFGEVPSSLVEPDIDTKMTMQWMDNVFLSQGLSVEIMEYDEVSRQLRKESSADDYKNAVFLAKQLKFSDAEMELWRRELERVEGEGDEDGFEEL